MSGLSARLLSLCGLVDGRAGASWSYPETDLVTLARRHRVEPLLYVRLTAPASGWRASKATMNALAQDYAQNTQRVLRSLVWLQRISEALAADGIEARPLKGLPLAAQAYERIADRHCGDLDLLIASNRSRQRADQIVRSLALKPELEMAEGPVRVYRALSKDDDYLSSDGLRIELHYQDGFGEHVFPAFLAFESRAWQPIFVDSIVTKAIQGTPLLLYLLSHGTRGEWSRLKWLLDIRRLTRGFDADAWAELDAAARHSGFQRHTAVGLRLLSEAFDANPPVARRASGFALNHCRKKLNEESDSTAFIAAQAHGRALYGLAVSLGWRARFALIGRLCFHFEDFAHWKLPIALIWILAPIVRPFSLVYRRVIRRLFH